MSGDGWSPKVLLCVKKFGSTGEVKTGVGVGASTAEGVKSVPLERLRFVDIEAVEWLKGMRLVSRVPEWS